MQLQCAVLASVLAFSTVALAQEPPPASPPDAQAQDAGGGRGGRAPEPQIRPYDRVITKEAKSDEGVFTVHRIKDRVYYEIPKDNSEKSSCGSARLPGRRSAPAMAARRPATGWCSGSDAAIASCSAASRTTSSPIRRTPISRAVQAANNDTIMMAFNIEALGKDDAPVIDVTRLFTTEVPEFSGRTRVRRADVRRLPLVHRARRVVPGKHRSRSDAHLHDPPDQRGRRCACTAPAGRARRRCAPAAPASSCTTAW